MWIQYIPRNVHTVFALLCFVVVIHWLIFPYPSGLLHWHCDNLTIAPVPAKQPWWIWINTSCEFIMNDCITTTKQSTTKPCAYFLGYTVGRCYHGDNFDVFAYTFVFEWLTSICFYLFSTRRSCIIYDFLLTTLTSRQILKYFHVTIKLMLYLWKYVMQIGADFRDDFFFAI